MALKKQQRSWLVTGGSGFIGQQLVSTLKKEGCRIFVLTRNQEKTQIKLGRHVNVLASLDELPATEKIDVIVNLAGEPLFGGLWTKRRKQAFFDSRLDTTKALMSLINRLETKPSAMISGSAIGYYGMQNDEICHECAPTGKDEMARLCHQWEQAASPASDTGVRVVFLRIGLVLDKAGGMLAPLMLATKLGLGARLGTGQQWMSWITRHDLVRMIQFIAEHPAVKGPVNGTAPNPVTQREFADALAKHVKRPRIFWAPASLLKILLGQMAELLLTGQKVLPRKATDMGFDYTAPNIQDAFK